jgi:two-component system, LytTR family, response regulator
VNELMSGRQYQVLVVEDEPLARQRLLRMVGRDQELTVAGEIGSVEELSRLPREIAVDLVLLDIGLPGRSGFDLLELLHQRGIDPFVIVTTASPEHAIPAFDVEAVDYLLKPLDYERFARAIARAKSKLLQGPGAAPPAPSALPASIAGLKSATENRGQPFPGRLMISERGRVLLLPTHVIEFIQAAGKSVKIYADGRCHVLRERLYELESRLDAALFIRIHRSTIVNVEHIVEMNALFHGDYELVLKRGTRLTMSRRFRDRMAPFLAGAWPT